MVVPTMTVESLIISGNYTPQQMITDLQNRVDDISELVVTIRWKGGHSKTATTRMTLERALTLYWIGVDNTTEKLRGRKAGKGMGGAA